MTSFGINITIGVTIFLVLFNFFLLRILPCELLEKIKIPINYMPLFYGVFINAFYFGSLFYLRSLPNWSYSLDDKYYKEWTGFCGFISFFIFVFMKCYKYAKDKESDDL